MKAGKNIEQIENSDFAETLSRASRSHQGYSGHFYCPENKLIAPLSHSKKQDKQAMDRGPIYRENL